MEKKPNKKEELTLVNNVLKLATKLLKARKKIEYCISMHTVKDILFNEAIFGLFWCGVSPSVSPVFCQF